MEKYREILRACPLFDGIEENHLLKMLSCLGARIATFEKKQTIFSEGTHAGNVGIVLSGSAQMIQNDYYGNRSIIADVAPSEMFAEDFACAEVGALPVSVIASEASDVMIIDCSHILHTCENNCGFHQRLIYNMMRGLAKKTVLFHQKIEIISKRTTRDKLLTYLSFMAKKSGKRSFDIPFDRQELADYLEVERSGLSTEIGKLKDEGALDARKNHFKLF